jgi:predicted metalloendopeptidase
MHSGHSSNARAVSLLESSTPGTAISTLKIKSHPITLLCIAHKSCFTFSPLYSLFSHCSIDNDADPCDNFYDFACGSFIEGTMVPDERAFVDTFSQHKDKIDQLLVSYLQKPTGELEQLARALNDACMKRNGEL